MSTEAPINRAPSREKIFESIKGTQDSLKPAIDVNRLARGGQVLGGIALVCATLVVLTRRL